MKGVIMAGGFGTRLRPLTIHVPKPMVPVLNRPMMEHIVRLVKTFGITDLISLLYFQADQIKSYFKDGREFGVDMEYSMAQDDLGTAGSVRAAAKMIDERFMVISGDLVTDLDLQAAVEFHQKKKSMATIVMTRVENPVAFGIVITEKDGKVIRFLEKPKWGEVFSDTINTGIYILEREVLDLIPEGKDFDFSKDLFPLMLHKKLPLYGYIGTGYWKDVGNLDQYRMVHLDIFSDRCKLQFPGEPYPGVARVYLEPGPRWHLGQALRHRGDRPQYRSRGEVRAYGLHLGTGRGDRAGQPDPPLGAVGPHRHRGGLPHRRCHHLLARDYRRG